MPTKGTSGLELAALTRPITWDGISNLVNSICPSKTPILFFRRKIKYGHIMTFHVIFYVNRKVYNQNLQVSMLICSPIFVGV